MGLIASVRANQRVAVVIAAILIVGGGIMIWRQTTGPGKPAVGEAFYTDDEGLTLFADSAERTPPFDHGGKEAVQAVVFSCDQGRHRWVQYLLKYSQDGLNDLQTMRAAGAHNAHIPPESALVKRPGDKKWIAVTDGASQTIRSPQCPDGLPGPPVEIRP